MATATRNDAYVNNGKTSKVKRYNWTISDRPGQFRMVHKDHLDVDLAYQRDAREAKIQKIASDWSWVACGAIIAALRDNVYYTMDGNHRVMAARKRSDIERLPCMVFETEDVQQEARGFLDANTLRKPVTAIEKFKAQVVIGDPDAVLVEHLLASSGYRVCDTLTRGQTIKCMKTLTSLAGKHRDLLVEVWPLIVAVSDCGPISERVVQSIVYVERKARLGGESLLRQPWKGRLLRLGYEGVMAATAKAAAYYSRGGEKVWGSGLVDALNRGVQHRLSLDGRMADDEPGE